MFLSAFLNHEKVATLADIENHRKNMIIVVMSSDFVVIMICA